jgi:hypothetical protein
VRGYAEFNQGARSFVSAGLSTQKESIKALACGQLLRIELEREMKNSARRSPDGKFKRKRLKDSSKGESRSSKISLKSGPSRMLYRYLARFCLA